MILKRLISLRGFIVVSFLLYTVGFDFSSSTIWFLVALSIASIVFSFVSWQVNLKGALSKNTVFVIQFLWDSGIIFLFVWKAGGSTNPFIYYQLLIVAVSANILAERFVWFFSAIGIAAYTLFMYLDMGQHIHHMDTSFKSHLIGMWINFSGSSVLIAFFISRLASALRRQEEALRLAREQNLKNEQLIGIGALAASTIHSFGTPLSTITMAASELDAIHPDKASRECTAVITNQIDRCKETMKKLTALTSTDTIDKQNLQVGQLVDELDEYLILVNAQPMPEFDCRPSTKDFLLPGGVLLLYAIINLVDNAVEAAKSRVILTIKPAQNSNRILIVIEDDGDGIKTLDSETVQKNSSGLGIGLFLVNSTIERLGGVVTIANPNELQSLTQVSVELPVVK